MSRTPVKAVLMAAGRGTRFGADKLMHPLADGTAIAVASARRLLAAFDASDIVAVLRPGAPDLQAALQREGLETIVCERAADGMGHSLAMAVAALPADHGIVVALADMPFIDPRSLAAVRDAIADGASIAAPVFEGRRGNPVGFAPGHRDALLSLQGDEGARRIVASAGSSIRLIEVDDAGIVADIDTPKDIAGR